MRIGIDIDNTITDTIGYLQKVIKKNNITDLDGDFDNYSNEVLVKYKDLIKENIEDVMTHCSLLDDVKKVIDYFRRSGHEIYLITARTNYYSENIYKITENYLREHEIFYDKLLFGYEKKKIFV